jgi:hypothetical protein
MIAGILLLLGAIWTLQGAGVLGGSVMSGVRTWLVAGVICLVVGLGLLGWTVAAARSRSGTEGGSTGIDRR